MAIDKSITKKIQLKKEELGLTELTDLLNTAEKEMLIKATLIATALTAADIGVWEWLPKNNRLTWSDKMFELFELDQPVDRELTYEDFIDCIHPDDVEIVNGLVQDCLHGAPYNFNFRVRRRDGSYKWIYGKGAVIVDARGSTKKMVGVCLESPLKKLTEDDSTIL